MGRIEPARKAILAALERGKSVVTANKALLAAVHRRTGRRPPSTRGVDLYFEAAVAGAIPVIRPLTQSLAGDTRAAGGRNRQRHHQLHPVGDGRAPARTTPTALAEASRARLRRGRSDRRRGGLRRRRQGGDSGLDRVPHPGDRRRRLPRGHHQGQLRPTSSPRTRSAARSSCWPSASGSSTTKASSEFRPGSTRHWCRSSTRWQRSTEPSTPWWSKPRPRAG